jgi:hypothetical protein
MPDLWFQTQQAEGGNRPDMCGYDGAEVRGFIENKFWAGLTENQPVSYLERLATCRQPTVLLLVVPEAREHTVWRELNRRLKEAAIIAEERDAVPDVACCASTCEGPLLALTSWNRLISALEREAGDDPRARGDLLQLRALCDAADTDVPISSTDVSDQRTPALVLQLASVVQKSVELADARGILCKGRLMPQADWERIGRYATFWDEQGVGIWLGIHFGLWKSYGETPLWGVFAATQWGRAREVRALLDPWAAKKGISAASQDDDFAIALDIVRGQENDHVVGGIVDRLQQIGDVLSDLKREGN